MDNPQKTKLRVMKKLDDNSLFERVIAITELEYKNQSSESLFSIKIPVNLKMKKGPFLIYVMKDLKEIADEEEFKNVKQLDINFLGEDG